MDDKGKYPNGFTSLVEELEMGPTALAKALGTSKQNIIRWTDQSRKIPIEWAEKIAAKFDRLTAEVMLPPDSLVGLNRVRLLSMVRAGKMTRDDVRDADIGSVVMAGLPKGDWVAFQVEGDSMDRISPPDSIIFVDKRDKKLVPNALYVLFDSEGNATYKRYRPNPARFEPVSTNSDIEPIYPDDDTKIFGRVRLTTLRT